jgi:hypothetical protein
VTALGEPVDHERVRRVGVRDAHVEEEVASAGDDEDAHDLGQVGGPVAESFDVLAGRGRIVTAIRAWTWRPSASIAIEAWYPDLSGSAAQRCRAPGTAASGHREGAGVRHGDLADAPDEERF